MSTKTTFKRIALVAVAALGLGVLSVAPSSAAVSGLSLTVTDGTAYTDSSSYDTSSAAIIEANYLALTTADTVTITAVLKTAPATQTTTANIAKLVYADTKTSAGSVATTATVSPGTTKNATYVFPETTTGFTLAPGATGTYAGGKFFLYLDTTNAVAGTTLAAGTYTYTIIATPYEATVAKTPVIKDVSIVVSKSAALSLTASTVYSTLSDPSVSTAVSTVSTSNAAAATLTLSLKNASNAAAANESVTATVSGPGQIGTSSNRGKSVVLQYTTGSDLTINVYADGTAGTSTITVSTPSLTALATKQITFYAKAATTLTASVAAPTLVIGSNDSAVVVTAVDSAGNNWAGQAYIVASSAADALIGGSATTPVACVYNTSKKVHYCPVTAIAGGTAKFKVIDASTVALATATSSEVSVTASAAAAASVKIEFDKATYAPFEKAYIKVSVLDAAGNRLGGKSYANALSSSGIATNIAFSGTAPTMNVSTVAVEAVNGTDKFAGYLTYVAYMPAQGTVTISATGGTLLPVAGQVSISASAAVVNSSVDAATDAANEATDAANAATDAALAAADAADAATAAAQDASDAVAALSATVAKLVASLKAQITSLTNLVIKIQKKVKA